MSSNTTAIPNIPLPIPHPPSVIGSFQGHSIESCFASESAGFFPLFHPRPKVAPAQQRRVFHPVPLAEIIGGPDVVLLSLPTREFQDERVGRQHMHPKYTRRVQ